MIIDALAYGAVFDGVTDDYAAIQAAANAAAGQTLVFPPRTARLSQGISYGAGTKIIGSYGQTWLKATAGNIADPALTLITSNGVSFEGVGFDGNISQITGFSNVCTVYQADKAVFRNCLWKNTRGIAVIFSLCDHSGVEDSSFTNCGTIGAPVLTQCRQAIAFSGDPADYDIGNFSRNNTFTGIGLDCVSMGYQRASEIDGNVVRGGYNSSLYGHYVSGMRITRNDVSNGAQGGNGIDMAGCSELVVSGNICVGNGSAGIMLAECVSSLISGNISKNNKLNPLYNDHKAGITIASYTVPARKISVVGNICDDTQTTPTQFYGLEFAGTGTFTEIYVSSDNVLRGYGSAGIPDESRNILNGQTANITEFPQEFALAANATRLLAPNGLRGEVSIMDIGNSWYGRFALISSSPIEVFDPGNHYETTDTGTSTSVYRDGSGNVWMRNRAAATRYFVASISSPRQV